MDQALVVQYLRRWQVEPADALAAKVEGCGNNPLTEEIILALAAEKEAMPISPVLAENRAVIRLLLGASPDLLERSLYLGSNRLAGSLFFLNEMSNRDQVMMILESLVVRLRNEALPASGADLPQAFLEQAIPSAKIEKAASISEVLSAVLSGDSVLLVDGLTAGLRFPTDSPPARKTEEPTGEPVVRGPKDGFTEVGTVNLALIRRRLRDDRLRAEMYTVGTRSHTRIMLVYMLGTSIPEVVDEVRSRLSRIKIDAVLESGYIEEMMEDNPWTLFPQVKATERPDVVVAGLLEGKVVLITDGTPHVIMMPATFVAEMQSAEDYYHRWPVSSFFRALRYLYLIVAFMGPAIYIAITTYHHELIPTNLLLSLISAREGVPFPAIVEALFMELSLEALREAGIRMPKPIGQTISIVGALVIGESAVRAGIVSPVMVIVVALTAISSFIIPLYTMSLAVRLLRFSMMLLAAVFGFFGMVIGFMAVLIHLNSLRSFGVPYLSPIMPPTAGDLRDAVIRAPWWAMRSRPKFMPLGDRRRGGASNRPQPPDRGE